VAKIEHQHLMQCGNDSTCLYDLNHLIS